MGSCSSGWPQEPRERLLRPNASQGRGVLRPDVLRALASLSGPVRPQDFTDDDRERQCSLLGLLVEAIENLGRDTDAQGWPLADIGRLQDSLLPKMTISATIRVMGGKWSDSLGLCMDIAEHLALHDSVVRNWVYKNVGGDFRYDAAQNIREAMIEAHEKGWYDHKTGELFTYIFPYLRGIAFRGIDPEYRYGITEELDMLQEIAEKATGRYGKDRDRGDKTHLDPLYDSPIPGLKTPLESTLTPEEQEQAEKLMGNLPDEEREILEASYGRSERQAAEILGIPKTTYRERLARARAQAEAILRMDEGA
jgi:RNA polymerase sigma factor (sigma-70 family)